MPIEIISGPLIRPYKTLIYGPEGIGKTTLVSQIAAVFGRRILFLDIEYGTRMQVERAHIRSMKEWDEIFEFLLKEKHPYDTIAIDTVSSLEPLVETIILEQKRTTSSGRKVTRIADYEYGKGSIYLREEFDRILFLQLDELIKLGITPILVGHTQVQRVNLPELMEGFDRYELGMDKRVGASLRQWSDNVLFCNWDIHVTTNEQKQPRGIAGKERVLYAQHTSSFDAKNRAGLAEKLKWDVRELAPIFAPRQGVVASVTNQSDGTDPHEAAWLKLSENAEFAKRDPAVLSAFFQRQVPNLKSLEDRKLIPLTYLERALSQPAKFNSTINEFFAQHGQTKTEVSPATTAETQPVAAEQS